MNEQTIPEETIPSTSPLPDVAETIQSSEVPQTEESAQPDESTQSAEAPQTDETDTTAADSPDWERLIAEAEERGYLRGRNEKIKALMSQPAMYEPPRPLNPIPSDDEILILNHPHRSVWD